MTLREPFSIDARLLPALTVGAGAERGTLSLEHVGYDDGRAVYKWYADVPAGEFSAADLKSGVGRTPPLQEMFGALLSFLAAAAEAYGYWTRNGMREGDEPESVDLFPRPVVEWAYGHADELSWLALDVEERPDLIAE